MKVLGVAGGLGDPVDEGSVDERSVDQIDARFEVLLADLAGLGDRVFIARAARFEQRLETARLLAVARLAGSTGDARTDRRRAHAFLSRNTSGGRSRRSVNRDARRAATLAANQALADRAQPSCDRSERSGGGGLSGDSLDVLSKAADPVSGAIPGELIDQTAGLEPDQVSQVVDRFLEQQTSAADADAKYRAQLRARRVRRYTVAASGADPALAGIGIEGPDAMIDQLWALINTQADAAYHDAGGRDRPAGDHAPLDHRRFDIAHARLCGTNGPSPSSGGRASVVVTVGLNDLTRHPDRKAATQIGCGPISDELLARYATNSDLSLLITGADNQPLWLGRTRRNASTAHYLALVIRDRGCVLCGAAHQRCHTHHILPWHAPGQGATDITNLALLCGPCHRQLHNNNHTLIRQPANTGTTTWATRPATPTETPPPTPIQRE